MTARDPRYVRVGTIRDRVVACAWECAACGAHSQAIWGRSLDLSIIARADRHARTCLAVRIAMERDRAVAERDRLQSLLDEPTRSGCTVEIGGVVVMTVERWQGIADMRDRYKAALESCEAAYAEAARTLRRQRDEAREARDSLTDELADERRVCRIQSHDRVMDDLADAQGTIAGLRQLLDVERGRTADAHAERDRMAATIGRLAGELEAARQQVWALIGEATC